MNLAEMQQTSFHFEGLMISEQCQPAHHTSLRRTSPSRYSSTNSPASPRRPCSSTSRTRTPTPTNTRPRSSPWRSATPWRHRLSRARCRGRCTVLACRLATSRRILHERCIRSEEGRFNIRSLALAEGRVLKLRGRVFVAGEGLGDRCLSASTLATA